jgi:hypothetical protein
MSRDIAKRLRQIGGRELDRVFAREEASNEIERLRAENERLRVALRPFGSVASIFENDDANRTVSLGRWYPSRILPEPGDFAADIKYTVADFRRARAALEEKK